MSLPVDIILPIVAVSLVANRTVVLQAAPGSLEKIARATPLLVNAP